MKALALFTALMGTVLFTSCSSGNNFTTGVVDFGIVVSDLDKSVKFYESIGFVKFGEFDVPKEVTGDAGLLDYKPLTIKVMTLNGDAADTKVKLMESKSAKAAPNSFTDSTLGMSYTTIFVKDAGKTLAMLKEKGIKVLNKGPVDLTPVGFDPNYLIVIRDPDGNLIEFVGPILTK